MTMINAPTEDDDLNAAEGLGDDTEDTADGVTDLTIPDGNYAYDTLRDDADEDLEEEDEARPVDELLGAAIWRDATGASADLEVGTGGTYGAGDADSGDEENFTDENEYTARRFSDAVGQ